MPPRWCHREGLRDAGAVLLDPVERPDEVVDFLADVVDGFGERPGRRARLLDGRRPLLEFGGRFGLRRAVSTAAFASAVVRAGVAGRSVRIAIGSAPKNAESASWARSFSTAAFATAGSA
jgi:hypothetical protein